MDGKLLILTEAGETIGLGHYSRCSAIKVFLDGHGLPTDIFLDYKGPVPTGKHFSNARILNWLPEIQNINTHRTYSHVLLDSYLAPLAAVSSLKNSFDEVVALDDYHRIDEGPDLIINPNIFGNKIRYTCKAVGGKDYIILRDSFRSETKKLEVHDHVQTILVTLGGSDFRNLLPRLLTIFLDSGFEGKVNIVAGKDEYSDQLRKQFQSVADRLDFYGFVPETLMKKLMLESDLVVSACGQTLHELAWLGVPCIGVCVGDDQILNMKAYVSNGFLHREIFWDSNNFDLTMNQELGHFSDPSERRKRSAAGTAVVGSKGLNNIYDAIFQ